MHVSVRPSRAPALYVAGFAAGESEPVVVFRLPGPPAWPGRPLGGWAAERRARKAYFAVLDAMRTGLVQEEQASALARLVRDVRSDAAREALAHLQRVLHAVTRTPAAPLLDAPPAPLTAVELAPVGPPGGAAERGRPMDDRYAWALDWLRTRGLIATSGLTVRWRKASPAAPPPG